MLQPLISYLIANGGFEGVPETWPELAERFGIKSEKHDTPRENGRRAQDKWRNFLGTERGLEFKKARVDGDGNVTSVTIGRAEVPKEIPDHSNMDVKFMTMTPNGGAFVRYEPSKEHPPPINERHRADIEAISSQKQFHVPTTEGHRTYIVLGCVHRPFHHKKVWNAIMSYIQDNRADIHGVILNGDYLDMRSLSGHDELNVLPEGIDLGVEYQDGYEGIMDMKVAFGGNWESLDKHYVYGNHEARYFKHIQQMKNSKYGAALMSPHEALQLGELGFNVQLDWKNGAVVLGDMEVCHGFYVGANAMKKHLEGTDKSVYFNHTHAVGEFKMGGRTAHNGGWLGDQESAGFSYASRFSFAGWQMGFGLISVVEGKSYVTRITCDNDGFFVGSKRY